MSLQKKLGEGPRANAPAVASLRTPTPGQPGAFPRTGQGDEAPIIELVDLIARSAVRASASDIHIEPSEKGLLVRHRLDGLLKEVMDLPKWVHDGLVARVKIMAGLDIAERRLPQDGRLRLQTDNGQPVDFRVSTLRTLHGEKIVLRLLDHQKGVPSLEQLLEVERKCKEAGIPCALITDSGCPDFFNGEPTVTALGVGPAKRHETKKILRQFKLL